MKTIYLIRHAKSSWKDASLNDFDRPLNKRGQKAAPFMADIMIKEGVKPDRFIASPAKRTMDTAVIFAKKMNYDADEMDTYHGLYESNYHQILNVIQSISNNYSTVFLFGHNPGLSQTLEYLTGEDLHLVTTAIVKIELDINEWKAAGRLTGSLEWHDYPKNHDENL